MTDDADELHRALSDIERIIREARGERVDRTPWDFAIPTGDDLQHMREECGLSLDDVAEKTGYSPKTIQNVEYGKPPGREFIQKMLRLYKLEWPDHGGMK